MAEKVDLNAGPIKEAGQPVASNNAEEMQEIAMIKQWMGEAKTFREPYEKRWDQQEQAYYGRIQQQTTGKKLKTRINVLRPIVQTVVALMTDAKPSFGAVPKTQGDIDFSELLSESVEETWDDISMPIKIVELITDMAVLDASVAKVTWDEDAEDGLGDVDCEPIDLRNIWVNKEAIDFRRKCKYTIESVVKTVGEWKRLFPEHANEIKPDTSDRDDSKEKDRKMKGSHNDGTLTLTSPVDQDKNKTADMGLGGGLQDDNAVATGWQVWYKDDAIEEYILNEDDGTERKVLKKKYPNGHLTTLLPNQNLILQSVENPYNGDSFNPYVRFIDTVVPRCFYGEGEVGPLIPTQSYLNRTATIIQDYLRLMANPAWILDKNSGVNTKALTNQIGLIIKKEPGTEVRRDFPQSIPSYVFEWFNTLLQITDLQSGIQEVTQGRKPAGITAAEAIETLQEAAQTKIRLKDRNFEDSMNHLGELFADRKLQFERGVRQKVKKGNMPDKPTFIEYQIDEIPGDGQAAGYTMVKKVSEFNPEAGEYVETVNEASTNQKGFNFKIESGTTLPFQKAQKGQRALNLFDRGAMGKKALLDSFDWPKAEEVLREAQEEQQALLEQQAAQQQPIQ